MRLRAMTVCAVLAAVGTGCGGDDEREAAAPATTATATAAAGGETMPADEWAEQVEELCDQHANVSEREALRIAQEVTREGGTQEEAVARALERGAELTEPMLDKVAAMPAPEGKERQAEEFDRRMRSILPVVKNMGDAVAGDDQAELKAISEKLLDEVLPVRALARDLNIHACIPRNRQP